MNDEKFYEIKNSLAKGDEVWLYLNSGKYAGSIARALDTKTHTSFYGGDYQVGSEYQYENFKIKFKINERNIWINVWNLRESSQRYEFIVIKSLDQKKQVSKDFLGREFTVDDVVFLYSSTYGDILGVINKINDKGSLTIRVAKKKNEGWNSDRAKQGIFVVPYYRADRILIIDDPAVLLLRA